MARQWIYLREEEVPDSQASIDNEKQLNADAMTKAKTRIDKGKASLKAGATEIKNGTVDVAGGTKDLVKAKMEKRKIESREKKLAKAAQANSAAGVQNTSASLLDEENDDALPIDTKDEDPKKVKKKLDKDDIVNEKQPLQEFMNFYKQISK